VTLGTSVEEREVNIAVRAFNPFLHDNPAGRCKHGVRVFPSLPQRSDANGTLLISAQYAEFVIRLHHTWKAQLIQQSDVGFAL
jgi:hypothetical protein